MDILILMATPFEASEIAQRLRAEGHKVKVCSDVGRAMVLSRAMHFDLLLASMSVAEEPTLSVVMSAQYHNANLATILLSDAAVFPQEDLFAMFTSLRCVMGAASAINDLVDIADYLLCEAEARITIAEPARTQNQSEGDMAVPVWWAPPALVR